MWSRTIPSLVRIALALLPLALSVVLDHDLSSPAHVAVLGVTGICVALCDALCGQIIANTRWMPFSACYTPSEAKEMAERFRVYHKNLFRSWLVAKACSAIAVVISAVMILDKRPSFLDEFRFPVLMVGYALLGVALVTAIEFIMSYFSAMQEADNAKLKEMNYTYKKEHPELFEQDPSVVKDQLEGFGAGYTSTPIPTKTV